MMGDEARSRESHFSDSAWLLDMYVTGERVVDHVGRQKSLCQAQDSRSPVKPVFYPDFIRLDGQVPRIRYFSSSHTLSEKFSTQFQSVLPYFGPSVKKCTSVKSVKGHAQAGRVPNVFPYSSKALLIAPAMYKNLYWSVIRSEGVCRAVLLGKVGAL